jgi:site-specific DNA recombinase
MTRAAIYCRISSDRDDERLGVERQETDCRRRCAERGWDVIEPPYFDNDITAADPRSIPTTRCGTRSCTR